MLEQLKEVIIEMELLMRDCCHPVMTGNEAEKCKTNSKPNVSEENVVVNDERRDNPEAEEHLLIRVDPCFRKVFSASIFPNIHKVDGDSDKRKYKKRVALCKLKSDNPPVQYSTIFQCNSDSDIQNMVTPKTEFSVKTEPQVGSHTNGVPGAEYSELNQKIPLLGESEGEEQLHTKPTCMTTSAKVY